MLIATFNCNSIRSRLGIVLDWLAEHRPDVLALQETKCVDEQFPAEAFAQAGWRVVYRGQKAYNGVALVSRDELADVSFGLGDDAGDSGPRLARGRLGDVTVLNTYVPQGFEIGSEKFQFKLEWFGRLRRYLESHFNPSADKLVWVGDLNVAPEAKDVYDPKGIWPHVCYCQEAIDALASVVSWGMEDVFRKHLPGEGIYTFWDYRLPMAAQRNRGWRLDHVWATAPAAAGSREAFVDVEPRMAEKPSDHTFVAARFGWGREGKKVIGHSS